MKKIWDNATVKILVFLGTSILIPAAVQFIGENFLEFEFLEGHPFLSFLIYCAAFLILTVLVICVVKLVKFLTTKRDYYYESSKIIEGVCSFYNFNSRFINSEGKLEEKEQTLYSLPVSNNKMHDNQNFYSKDKNKQDKMKSNIIYYGFSAKKYLNWIDFVYLNFLRKLKEKLNCKVVISLHYPDYIKECKINDSEAGIDKDPNEYIHEYQSVVKYFSKYVKRIVGDDVIIKTEDEFYKENVKKYAEDFHNVYVAMSLFYANQIGKEVNGKKFVYKDYKRKLSHIESAFPTWMMSTRSKHDRIFVLDNKLSQLIWDVEPLKTIRKEHDIFFIEVNDLNNGQGERLDVHKAGNCINLTDHETEIMHKIEYIDDVYELQMMVSLLDEAALMTMAYREPSEKGIQNTLFRIIKDLISKYEIKPAEVELAEYGLKL